MTNQQKKAATALSLTIIAIASAFLLWTAVAVMIGKARGDQTPGRLFMLAISTGGGLDSVLKLLPALISVGLAAIGAYKLKDFLFYIIIAASATGLLSTIYLFLELRSVDTARSFFEYSPIESLDDYASFVSKIQTSLGAVSAWFLTAILLELGVKGAFSASTTERVRPNVHGEP